MMDILEGRPYGRLMVFDPAANNTTVLLRDLYFANGVALLPDQASLVYCETILRRCRRYHIRGEKKGTVERFLDDLPGYPDNIRYDGEGHFWIGLSAGKSRSWDVVLKYPWVRKLMLVAMKKYVSIPHFVKGSGVLRASLQGEPLSLYTDPALELVTGGLKIGRHLYYGSLVRHYFSRIRLDKLAASSK
uniref:Adipocyte plasma membrane-associated protein n=1 Tax=Anthurium amnicola TaxID=1678845 RepID=A0A1D1Y891_9ARAE